MNALLAAFDMKVDHRLLIRRLGVAAGNLQAGVVQLDLFTDYEAQEREERLQRVLLSIRARHVANSILKAKNYQPGATARQRNEQIGGHRA